MNRSERRRYEKEFSKALKKAGDACGICRKPLPHNSRTFGGVLPSGHAALAGECCREQLDIIMGSGVYINQNTDAIIDAMGQMKGEPNGEPASNALEASKRLQSGIGSLEQLVESAARRAGVSGPVHGISLQDNPWKTEDAQWFKDNPDRSHRMRPMTSGEQETLPTHMKEAVVPDGHRWEILIRQVKEGQRIRTAFCRNTLMDIPDEEAVIHAIFDTVSHPQRAGMIKVEEIATLAKRYQMPNGSAPN